MFDDRAELIEALEQERERSDILAKELADVLDTLRVMARGMDALGDVAISAAHARTEDGAGEWRSSIANKRDALTAAVSSRLSGFEPTPKPKRKRKPA